MAFRAPLPALLLALTALLAGCADTFDGQTITVQQEVLSGCMGNAVTVSGQGVTSGTKTKTLDCGATGHIASAEGRIGAIGVIGGWSGISPSEAPRSTLRGAWLLEAP